MGFNLALGGKETPGFLLWVGFVLVGLSAGKQKFPMGCSQGTQVQILTQPLTGCETLGRQLNLPVLPASSTIGWKNNTFP